MPLQTNKNNSISDVEFTTHSVAELKKNTIFVSTFHVALYVLKCRSLFTMMKKDGTVTITYFEKKPPYFFKFVKN